MNTSRSNTLMPQPVSGVPSRSNPAAHAVGDARRQPAQPGVAARRAIAHHQAQPRRRGACVSASSSCGMSAGSFWPSPSSVAIQRRARLRARRWPPRRSGPSAPTCRSSRISGMPPRARREHRLGRAVGAAVVDEDRLEAVRAGERGVDLARQRQDVVLLVADGDDDRHVEGRIRRAAVRRIQGEDPAWRTLV